MSPDLDADLAMAREGMTFAACLALDAMGVPRGMIAELTGAGEIGRLRVRETASRWEPDETGAWRLILPVRDAAFEIVDLVAIASSDADRWTLRTGDGVMLSPWLIAEADLAACEAAMRRADGLPLAEELRAALTVRLLANPIAWLAAEGKGICVLDWRPAALSALRGLGPEVTLLADDGAAAQRLHELLQWGGLPEIKAAPRERRLAA